MIVAGMTRLKLLRRLGANSWAAVMKPCQSTGLGGCQTVVRLMSAGFLKAVITTM